MSRRKKRPPARANGGGKSGALGGRLDFGQDTTPPRPCPDCTASVVDDTLTHDGSCPFFRAEAEMTAADREWFGAHPGARSYVRPITGAEVAEMRLVGRLPDGFDVAGDVEVTQLAPGVRFRRLAGAYMFPRGAA